MPESLG